MQYKNLSKLTAMNKTENIKQYARALRLPTLATTCDDLIHQVQIDTPSYLEFTEMILCKEIEQRQKNDFEKSMKAARLPLCHDLDAFDFNYSAGITKLQMKQLRELVWLEQNYNVVLMGPSGVAKSFIASGLVYEAVKQGYRAYFYTMEDIINIIRIKDLSSSALAAYTKLMKVHRLSINDMMLLPIK